MLFLLGSANRDDRRFPDGDTFDIHRNEGRHLTFGNGIHLCMGAALARMEGCIALDEVLSRFPEMGDRSGQRPPVSRPRPSGAGRHCRQLSDSSIRERRPFRKRRRRVNTTARCAANARSRLVNASSRRDAGCSSIPPFGTGSALTIRGVAEQAGVNERTVYRYFGNERGLRDAVMHRLEQEAGIDLEGMRLEDIADIAARIFAHVSSLPAAIEATSRPDADRREPSPKKWSFRSSRRLDGCMA